MSNNQMISVPREQMERFSEVLEVLSCHITVADDSLKAGRAIHSEMSAILAQPAEQHQGEPVACQVEFIHGETPRVVSWNDRPAGIYQLYTRPVQGEPVAYLITPPGCSPALVFARDIRSVNVYTAPLYTHADPAEVERLRTELENSYTVAEHERLVAKGQETNTAYIKALRAQLAEQGALLRKVPDMPKSVERRLFDDADPDGYLEGDGDWCDNNPEVVAWLIENHEAIRAALSASAEPSAPPEQSEWHPLTAPGQIQEGDRLSFKVGSSFICARARQIIALGTDKEEVVYNRKKNHYFVTSMAVDGTSSHKNVMVSRVTA